MESHEWHDRTEEGVRYYRANRHAGKWSFITTLKTEPEWYPVETITETLWRELRDVLWRKYQRKRCPWEFIAEIDKILGEEPKPEGR